jgi:hypothetical protein
MLRALSLAVRRANRAQAARACSTWTPAGVFRRGENEARRRQEQRAREEQARRVALDAHVCALVQQSVAPHFGEPLCEWPSAFSVSKDYQLYSIRHIQEAAARLGWGVRQERAATYVFWPLPRRGDSEST